MVKTKPEKIAGIEEQIQQLENQKKRLIQEQKVQERKDRTKRLCKRMGLFESMLPDTITLTDEQFKTFLEKAVLSDYSRRILDGLTAQNAATDVPQTIGTAAYIITPPTAKPAETEQNEDTSESEERGNGGTGERRKGALIYHMNVVSCGLPAAFCAYRCKSKRRNCCYTKLQRNCRYQFCQYNAHGSIVEHHKKQSVKQHI